MIEKPRVLRIHDIPFRVHLLPMAIIPQEFDEEKQLDSRVRDLLLSFINYERRIKFQRANISPQDSEIHVPDFVKFFGDVIDRDGVFNYRFCNRVDDDGKETKSMEFHNDSAVALELKLGAQKWLRLDRVYDMDDRFELALEYSIQQDKRIERDLRHEINQLREELEQCRLVMTEMQNSFQQMEGLNAQDQQQQITEQIKQYMQTSFSSTMNENIEQLQNSFEERIQEVEQKMEANKNNFNVQINNVNRSVATNTTSITALNQFKARIEEEEEKRLKAFTESAIIGSNETYRNQLKTWIGNFGTQVTLLYRGTRDGFGAANFHQKCDNQGSTLTIVRCTGGYIFGGYTDISWDSSGQYKNSSNSWLFALSSNYNGTTPVKLGLNGNANGNAIYCNSGYGPSFGSNHDLHIANAANSNTSSYSNLGGSYVNGGHQYLFTGSQNFQVSEIEVYKV